MALSVLLCSGVCIFLPSVLAAVGEKMRLTVSYNLGPFVVVGLLVCGIVNAFLFGVKHSVIRKAIRAIFIKSNNNQTPNFIIGLA